MQFGLACKQGWLAGLAGWDLRLGAGRLQALAGAAAGCGCPARRRQPRTLSWVHPPIQQPKSQIQYTPTVTSPPWPPAPAQARCRACWSAARAALP